MTKTRMTKLEGMTKTRMTKLEGMTNDQVPGDYDIVFSAFGLRVFFIIRYSCFVISSS